jgi:transposase
MADITGAVMLADRLPPACRLIADKAYDADHWRAWLAHRRIRAVIPNKANRKHLHAFDAKRYKDRNTIERMFGRLKDFRRIATRYDKKAENFMAALYLAAIICYWI